MLIKAADQVFDENLNYFWKFLLKIFNEKFSENQKIEIITIIFRHFQNFKEKDLNFAQKFDKKINNEILYNLNFLNENSKNVKIDEKIEKFIEENEFFYDEKLNNFLFINFLKSQNFKILEKIKTENFDFLIKIFKILPKNQFFEFYEKNKISDLSAEKFYFLINLNFYSKISDLKKYYFEFEENDKIYGKLLKNHQKEAFLWNFEKNDRKNIFLIFMGISIFGPKIEFIEILSEFLDDFNNFNFLKENLKKIKNDKILEKLIFLSKKFDENFLENLIFSENFNNFIFCEIFNYFSEEKIEEFVKKGIFFWKKEIFIENFEKIPKNELKFFVLKNLISEKLDDFSLQKILKIIFNLNFSSIFLVKILKEQKISDENLLTIFYNFPEIFCEKTEFFDLFLNLSLFSIEKNIEKISEVLISQKKFLILQNLLKNFYLKFQNSEKIAKNWQIFELKFGTKNSRKIFNKIQNFEKITEKSENSIFSDFCEILLK